MSQKVDFMEVVWIFFLLAKGLAKTIYISRGDDHLQMKETEPHKDWTLDAGGGIPRQWDKIRFDWTCLGLVLIQWWLVLFYW